MRNHLARAARRLFTSPRRAACSLTMALLVVTQSSVFAPPARGYAADGTSNQSTFHYDMTRVLARAAGVKNFEYLAVATEAIDNGTFAAQGIRVNIIHAQRFARLSGDNNFYFHWGRRSPFYPASPFAGASADTCAYFAGNSPANYETHSCDALEDGTTGWEIDQIRQWAMTRQSGLISLPGSPPVLVKRGSRGDIRGQTLEALAVYLHSLGDSYSHDECMYKLERRSHDSAVSQTICGVPHHRNGELGPGTCSRETTRHAAVQIWKALQNFCKLDREVDDTLMAFCGDPVWSDPDIAHTANAQSQVDPNAWAFIDHFVARTASGEEREAYAECVVQSLADAAGCASRSAQPRRRVNTPRARRGARS